MLNYSDYYKEAKKKKDSSINLYDTQVKILPRVVLTKNLLAEVQENMRNGNIFKVPGRSEKDDLMVRIDDIFKLKELNPIVNNIIPILENSIYGCNVHLHRVYIYKNLVKEAKRVTSFLWHYDNHPAEIYKVMIYLNDVDEYTAPFEFLQKDGTPISVTPSRTGSDNWKPPKWQDSRVPKDVMSQYLDSGVTSQKVVGRAGTAIIFDNNVIHRANLAEKKERFVAVLQVKPTIQPKTPYLDKKWTGSFKDPCLDQDPSK